MAVVRSAGWVRVCALNRACRTGTFGGLAAEIAAGDPWMGKQFLCASCERDSASFEYVGAIGGLQSKIGHLLDEQDRFACAAKLVDDLEDLLHDQRREPKRRLVEEQQTRPCHQPAPARPHPP